jgi:hypothetical protein
MGNAKSSNKKMSNSHMLCKPMSGRKSNLAIENKLLIYSTKIVPIWTFGLELWGCASKSNISIIQRSQSEILRMIVLVDVPWYVSNATLHTDLDISYVQDVIHPKCNKHQHYTRSPRKPAPQNTTGKRNWPIDLI